MKQKGAAESADGSQQRRTSRPTYIGVSLPPFPDVDGCHLGNEALATSQMERGVVAASLHASGCRIDRAAKENCHSLVAKATLPVRRRW